jgi:hypothetical protein
VQISLAVGGLTAIPADSPDTEVQHQFDESEGGD